MNDTKVVKSTIDGIVLEKQNDKLNETVREKFEHLFPKTVFEVSGIVKSYHLAEKVIFFTVYDDNKPKTLLSVCVFKNKYKDCQLSEQTAHKFVGLYIKVQGHLSLSFRNELQINIRTSEDKLSVINGKKVLPKFCENIAVISREEGKGLIDFKKYLKYGSLVLFNTRINSSKDIVSKIREINSLGNYDCICIVRGGASEKVFSGYNNSTLLAETIKTSAIPVILAIGHSNDEFSALDKYACYSAGTPTEAAIFLNNRMQELYNDLDDKLLMLEKRKEDISNKCIAVARRTI